MLAMKLLYGVLAHISCTDAGSAGRGKSLLWPLLLSPFLSALIHSPGRVWHYEDSLLSCCFSSLMQLKFSFCSTQVSLYFFGLPSHFPFFPAAHPLKRITLIFKHGTYIYACISVKKRIAWHVAKVVLVIVIMGLRWQ